MRLQPPRSHSREERSVLSSHPKISTRVLPQRSRREFPQGSCSGLVCSVDAPLSRAREPGRQDGKAKEQPTQANACDLLPIRPSGRLSPARLPKMECSMASLLEDSSRRALDQRHEGPPRIVRPDVESLHEPLNDAELLKRHRRQPEPCSFAPPIKGEAEHSQTNKGVRQFFD